MNASLPDLSHDPGIQRILVIKWSALGDVLIATALMEDLHQAFPHAAIDLNTLPSFEHLFRDDGRFRRVIALDIRRRARPLGNMMRWVRQMRQSRYDLIVDLQSNDRSRLLLALLTLSGGGGRHRLGINPGWPYTIVAPAFPRGTHTLTRCRALLNKAGIPTTTDRPVLSWDTSTTARANALKSAAGLPDVGYALVLPGSNKAGELKRWGTSRFAQLAKALLDAGVPAVAVIGGPDERDVCSEIAAQAGDRVVDLSGQTQITDIIALANDACLIVANDTGTAHVASAAGKPMVVICGPTDPRRVKPIGEVVTALQAQLPCINCYRKHCVHHSCMALISPFAVLEHLKRRGILPPAPSAEPR